MINDEYLFMQRDLIVTVFYRRGWRWFPATATFLHSKNSRSKIDKEVNF